MTKLQGGLVLLAAIAWLFATIGWFRTVRQKSDAGFRDRMRDVALIMIFTSAATAAVAAVFVS